MENNFLSSATALGSIQDVSGSTVSAILNDNHLSGLVFVHGQGYRVGQLGSFVKIPMGFIDLFGIVTHVGASAVPENQSEQQPYGRRWIKIQLVGEGSCYTSFQRGITQYPTVDDDIYLVSENDLSLIYGKKGERNHFVRVGHVSGSESIDALVDINKLVTRHSAIVGSTGSGKSTTVASILSKISCRSKFPSARVLVLDIHGEYGRALKDEAYTYKLEPEKKFKNERSLALPYWALSFDELISITFGDLPADGKARNIILENILEKKKFTAQKYLSECVSIEDVTADSPIPFSIKTLWYELYCKEFGTYYANGGKNKPIQENYAYEKTEGGDDIIGDVDSAIPPKFKPPKNVASDPEKIQYLPDALNIRSSLENLGAKLRISRFDFLFKPNDWTPDCEGKTNKDLPELMKDWLGSDRPITILDLSGVPNIMLNNIIGVLLRIVYDGLFWARNLSQGGRERPLLVVMEEAHAYLYAGATNRAATMVKKIVKEGRKYGVGAMVVSQRPAEIDPTILSQCGTLFALRLNNSTDRSHIVGTLPDSLEGITDMLPVLRTGEAIILGDAVELPMRTKVQAPPRNMRPDSDDPVVADPLSPEESMTPGSWNIPMEREPNYKEFCIAWRKQRPYIFKKE